MANNIFYLTEELFSEKLGAAARPDTLVIISKSAAERFQLTGLLAGWPGLWLDFAAPNPNQYSLYDALQRVQGHPLHTIIAIGGGSSMDLAKLVAAFAAAPLPESPHALLQAAKENRCPAPPQPPVHIIAVPTTAGTGSEVTEWATLWDKDEKAKYSVQAPWLMPAQAWIVPALTLALPPRLTLAAGLDAITQAIEAYWARKSDPLAKALALQAIRILHKALPQALQKPASLDIREAMCTGSLMAGLAFSRTKTTACHSISYPITAHFGVEHGFAAALTLAPVAALNSEKVNCAPLFDIIGTPPQLQQWLDDLCAPVQPLRLSAFGIPGDAIPLLADKAFTAGRMDNNPVPLNAAAVEAILRQVYS